MSKIRNGKKTLSFNVITLIKIIRNDRRAIALWLCGFGIFGVIVAFSIPKEYSTTVSLAPEVSGNNMLSKVSSLASMVGLYNDANPDGDAIYPEIYPDIMSSTNFLVSLFDIKVKTPDGKVNTTYYQYLKNDQKSTWWSYPFMLIGKLLSNLASTPANPKGQKGVNPFWLTREQHDIASCIDRNITCSVDKKTNVIEISVVDQNPYVSAALTDSVKNVLQRYITKYKTTKARNDLKFMEKLCEEAREKYVKMRQRYASFSDSNTDAILASVRLKQDDMENDMQLQYNIYTQLEQQLQMARAKVQERTPAFTVIQPASVPLKHCNKPKILYLITYLFLGFIFRLSILVWKNKKQLFVINDISLDANETKC